MSESYDSAVDGYPGWDDDAEYAQFQRDYEEWLEAQEHQRAARTSTAHLDAMDRLGRRPS